MLYFILYFFSLVFYSEQERHKKYNILIIFVSFFIVLSEIYIFVAYKNRHVIHTAAHGVAVDVGIGSR